MAIWPLALMRSVALYSAELSRVTLAPALWGNAKPRQRDLGGTQTGYQHRPLT